MTNNPKVDEVLETLRRLDLGDDKDFVDHTDAILQALPGPGNNQQFVRSPGSDKKNSGTITAVQYHKAIGKRPLLVWRADARCGARASGRAP